MSTRKFFMSTLFRAAIATSVGFLLLLAITFVGRTPSALAASTLTVTTTADLSSCTKGTLSLRCALDQANAAGSGDTIAFHIPSTDPGCSPNRSAIAVCTISITDAFNPLPQLTASNTTINGYTQPGARPNTNPLRSGDNAILALRLDGGSSLSVSPGFGVAGPGDTIEGFSITDFNNGISTSGTGHVTVQGNFIGIAPDGSTQGINATGVFSGGGSIIGGTHPADSNVISGNFQGVSLASGDIFQGNIVGLNSAGNAAILNLLAGNIPGDGILAGGNTLIGGTTSGAGNVISGNASGIRMGGSSNLIEGNLIGTDVTGKVAIGNEEGITITASNSTIGGLVPTARNIISGNFNFGIDMGNGSGNVVEGNYIGTDVTGEVALGNGGQNGASQDASAGVYISTSRVNTTNNVIGGTTSAARNVISGNAFNGVQITATRNFSFANTKNNLVEGNFIGLDATSTKALGNGTDGVFIASTAGFGGQLLNNAVTNNVIAHNGKSGILIGASSTDKVVHSPISQNSLFANGGLGIDLAPEGVVNCTTNPPGPNDYTHCPVIAQATTTQITGTAPAGSTVEVFIASNEQNDQGHGEGQTFLGSASANASGHWSLTLTTGKVAQGQLVTATATTRGTTTETSEFAANVVVH